MAPQHGLRIRRVEIRGFGLFGEHQLEFLSESGTPKDAVARYLTDFRLDIAGFSGILLGNSETPLELLAAVFNRANQAKRVGEAPPTSKNVGRIRLQIETSANSPLSVAMQEITGKATSSKDSVVTLVIDVKTFIEEDLAIWKVEAPNHRVLIIKSSLSEGIPAAIAFHFAIVQPFVTESNFDHSYFEVFETYLNEWLNSESQNSLASDNGDAAIGMRTYLLGLLKMKNARWEASATFQYLSQIAFQIYSIIESKSDSKVSVFFCASPEGVLDANGQRALTTFLMWLGNQYKFHIIVTTRSPFSVPAGKYGDVFELEVVDGNLLRKDFDQSGTRRRSFASGEAAPAALWNLLGVQNLSRPLDLDRRFQGMKAGKIILVEGASDLRYIASAQKILGDDFFEGMTFAASGASLEIREKSGREKDGAYFFPLQIFLAHGWGRPDTEVIAMFDSDREGLKTFDALSLLLQQMPLKNSSAETPHPPQINLALAHHGRHEWSRLLPNTPLHPTYGFPEIEMEDLWGVDVMESFAKRYESPENILSPRMWMEWTGTGWLRRSVSESDSETKNWGISPYVLRSEYKSRFAKFLETEPLEHDQAKVFADGLLRCIRFASTNPIFAQKFWTSQKFLSK